MATELEFTVKDSALDGGENLRFRFLDSDELREKCQLGIHIDDVPVEFTHAHYRLTVRLSKTRPDVATEIGDTRAVLVYEAERTPLIPEECGFELTKLGNDIPFEDISLLWDDIPEWIEPEDASGYVTLEFVYDHQRTLEESPLSPKDIERERGKLDRTTPGVDVRWKKTEAAPFESTAIDTETGHVFLAGNGCEADLRAVDIESGEEVWQVTIENGPPKGLATLDETVFAQVAGNIVALDAFDGTVNWSEDVGPITGWTVETVAGSSDDHSTQNHFLIVLSGKTVTSIDPDSGEQNWKSIPAIAADKTSSLEDGGNPSSVSELTHVPAADEASQGATMLYLRGEKRTPIYAIDAETGSLRWSFEVDDWIYVPLTVVDDTTFVGTRDNFLYAFDAITGNQEQSFELSGPVNTQVYLFEGVIYFACARDLVYAVDIGDWDPLWTDDVSVGDPEITVASASVFLTQRASVRRLDAKTGNNITTFDIRDTGPVTEECLYGASSSHTHVFSLATDTIRWRYKLRGNRTLADELLIVDVSDAKFPEVGLFALEETEAVRLPFDGVLKDLTTQHSRDAIFSLNGSSTCESLVLGCNHLPYYGRFIEAHYEIFLAIDVDYEEVTGEYQRASDRITEFEAIAVDQVNETVTLELTEYHTDTADAEGELTILADRLPADLREEGDEGYVSIYLEYDEEATPDEVEPTIDELEIPASLRVSEDD